MKDFHKNFSVFVLFCLLFTGAFQFRLHAQYIPDESMNMKAFESKVLLPKDEIWVIDFWASWCGSCLQSIPEMVELHEKFAGKPVRFVSISWDKNKAAWYAMLQKSQMPWQQILIPDIRNTPFIDKHFKHNFMPSLFLVSFDGKVKKVEGTGVLEEKVNKQLGAKR